jgi:hypothetical protein
LSGDLMKVPDADLWSLRVERTVIGGETVYARSK